jgi:hypothetical protein
MVAKVIACGFVGHPHAYLRDSYCVLDFAVVTLAWVSFVVPGAGRPRVLPVCSPRAACACTHSTRHPCVASAPALVAMQLACIPPNPSAEPGMPTLLTTLLTPRGTPRVPGCYPAAGNLTGLRTIRAMRPLRTLQYVPGMRTLVTSITQAVAQLGSVLAILGFLLLIFGILGVGLFQGSLHYHCTGGEPLARVLRAALHRGAPPRPSRRPLVALQRLPSSVQAARKDQSEAALTPTAIARYSPTHADT